MPAGVRPALWQDAWPRLLRVLRGQEREDFRLALASGLHHERGVPVACVLLPASYHDLTPLHDLLYGLPSGAYVYADKAYTRADDEASILTETGVHLVPIRTDNRAPNTWAEGLGLRAFRKTIETVNSQFEAMGLQRLRARTNAGFEIKVQASVLALACANAD